MSMRMKYLTRLVLICLAVVASSGVASAGSVKIGIMSGGVKGTYVQISQNLSDALDSKQLRIITMLGKGSKQNVRDLIEMDGVDMAIVQSDVLQAVISSNELPGASTAIQYITKLYNEEIHIVTRKGMSSIKSLEGAAIGVGRKGSGTEMTARVLLKALGIDYTPINLSADEAIANLKEEVIDAAVFVVGKPSSFLQTINADANLNFMSIRLPKNVEYPYVDTSLSHADYPNLIPKGGRVNTVAVGAVLAVFNWREGSRRYQILAEFTKQFYQSIDQLKGGSYHRKWADIDWNFKLGGWTRFKPAQALVKR